MAVVRGVLEGHLGRVTGPQRIDAAGLIPHAARVVGHRVSCHRHGAEQAGGVSARDREHIGAVRVGVIAQHLDLDRTAVVGLGGVVDSLRSIVDARDGDGHRGSIRAAVAIIDGVGERIGR